MTAPLVKDFLEEIRGLSVNSVGSWCLTPSQLEFTGQNLASLGLLQRGMFLLLKGLGGCRAYKTRG